MSFEPRQLRFAHGEEWENRNYYNPSDISGLNEKLLRQEYTELRDIAQKRLSRLRANYPESEILKYHEQGFKKLKDIKTKKELAKELSELSKFVNSKMSTVAGQKEVFEDKREKLSEYGLVPDDIKEADFKAVMKFVDYVRDVLHENVLYHDLYDENGKMDKDLERAIKSGQYSKAYYLATGRRMYDQFRSREKAKYAENKNYQKRNYSEVVRESFKL